MSILSLIRFFLGRRRATAQASVEVRSQQSLSARIPVPLGLHLNSSVEISPLVHVLAEGGGSIIPAFDETQYVTAVGKTKVFGMDVYRSYLSDGKSMIQTVLESGKTDTPVEIRFYTQESERFPQTLEEWSFFLEKGEGMIGWPAFQIPDAQGQEVLYNRSWNSSSEWIPPIEAHEKITFESGEPRTVGHRMMQYWRQLPESEDLSEYLIASVHAGPQGEASVVIHFGLNLRPEDLKVFRA